MKQAKAKREPNAGSWKAGCPSPNPAGRPRSGLAFAEAVRERIDPHKVLDLVEKHLCDETISIEKRLAVVMPFVQSGFVRPPTELALNVTAGVTRDLSHVPLEKLEAALALLETDDQRLPEPSVTDEKVA